MDGKRLSDKEIIKKYAKIKASLDSLKSGWSEIFVLASVCNIAGSIILVIAIPIMIIWSLFALPIYFWKKGRFLANTGISFEQASSNFEFISDNIVYIALIRQLCMLNPSAKPGQIALIKELYGVDESIINEYIFDDNLSDEDLEFYKKYSKKMTLSAKKAFAHKLFKLAIVEDGIRNDEWNLLMNILEQLDFNQNYINYFIKRYKPLRTEYDDYGNKDNSSAKENSVSLLKPYYDILGVDENASDEEIKRAYHNLALQHHPDLAKNAGRVKESEQMMAKINEAYEKIRN